MSINETKLLEDKELVDIVRRAGDEIECSDAYRHFMEDLAGLVTKHFGGEVEHVNGPVGEYEHEKRYRCDNCQELYTGDDVDDTEVIPLAQCENLFERLTSGCVVPDGECPKCGAFVYAERDIDTCWVASIAHNECVPDDGGVFKEYDTDIDWNQVEDRLNGNCGQEEESAS